MDAKRQTRCVNCREAIPVPERYAHGDHIRCGTCGTQHKVARGDMLRIVLADTAPLREALNINRQRIGRLQDDLRRARGSIGIGVNGAGIGVAWAVYQVGVAESLLDRPLLVGAVGVALVSGLMLELANFFFMAKRKVINHLSTEIEAARNEQRQIQRQLRDAARV